MFELPEKVLQFGTGVLLGGCLIILLIKQTAREYLMAGS